jgi:glycerophosphoryl diester phosphodiesterase
MNHCGRKLVMFILIFGICNIVNSKAEINHLIAHAGGSLDGEIYLNTKKAILKSIKNNFINIELDLKITSDGKIYSLHEWEDIKKFSPNDVKKLMYKDKKNELIYDDLVKFNEKNFFQILVEKEIIEVFNTNPHLILFIDKINNFQNLKRFFKKINNEKYLEVYSLKDYFFAKAYGIKNIIYSSNLNKFDMIAIKLLNISKVSISKNFINDKNKVNFILNQNHKITFFCYTINDYDFIENYKENIKYFFTDFLIPNETLFIK